MLFQIKDKLLDRVIVFVGYKRGFLKVTSVPYLRVANGHNLIPRTKLENKL